MSDNGSEISEGVEEESRMTFRPWGHPRDLKDWLASIRKGQLIYKLFEIDTLYLAYNAAEGKVSGFIESCLMGDPQLTWIDLENLMINEFADI